MSGNALTIFDLDGTLADHSHRLPLVLCERPDYEAYHERCLADVPRKPILRTLHLVTMVGWPVEIWTGRPERLRKATELWFRQHTPRAKEVRMRMRPDDDTRSSIALKRDWLADVRQRGDGVYMAFEDRRILVDWWRSEGILCCQVVEGDY